MPEIWQIFSSLLWKQRVASLELSVGGLETILAFPGGVPRGGNKPNITISVTGNSLIHEQLQIYLFANVPLNLALNLKNHLAYLFTTSIIQVISEKVFKK